MKKQLHTIRLAENNTYTGETAVVTICNPKHGIAIQVSPGERWPYNLMHLSTSIMISVKVRTLAKAKKLQAEYLRLKPRWEEETVDSLQKNTTLIETLKEINAPYLERLPNINA